MTDEVIPAGGLPDGETMRVVERAVELPGGATVWLRRWVRGPAGQREWLADGRWCATRGDIGHLYAGSGGIRGGFEWLYRSPESYPTWEDALEAARGAEDADGVLGRVASARAAQVAS